MRFDTSRATRRDELGVTLIELVVATALLSLVMVLMLSGLWQAQRSESFSRGRTEALDDMRQTINRMTKDFRQVSDVNGTPTASALDVDTYVGGVETRVRYEVTGDTLTRQLGTATPVVVQDGLISTDIFTYSPDALNPNMVIVVISLKPANLPETVLTLDSEIEFRNA